MTRKKINNGSEYKSSQYQQHDNVNECLASLVGGVFGFTYSIQQYNELKSFIETNPHFSVISNCMTLASISAFSYMVSFGSLSIYRQFNSLSAI